MRIAAWTRVRAPCLPDARVTGLLVDPGSSGLGARAVGWSSESASRGGVHDHTTHGSNTQAESCSGSAIQTLGEGTAGGQTIVWTQCLRISLAFLQQCGLGLTHVQGPEQVLPVHVPEKDPALAALGTAQDMVNGARLLNAQLARHARESGKTSHSCN